MSQEVPIPPPGFDDLSIDEKIDYIQLLWARISANSEDAPVPEWHREVIAERLAAYRSDPAQGGAWDEVRDDILRRLRSRSARR